jgi:hypothetical protein
MFALFDEGCTVEDGELLPVPHPWDPYQEIPTAEIYLGSCFSIMPSGKYYMPWACSNVTEAEALQDELYSEALDQVAEEYDMFVFGGEGDPTDIFAGYTPSTDDLLGVWAEYQEKQSEEAEE